MVVQGGMEDRRMKIIGGVVNEQSADKAIFSI